MSHELHNPADADELRDRLIDRGLREYIGGEAPRNLSERILAAAGDQAADPLATLRGAAINGHEVVQSRSESRWPWVQLAVAATLLIGAGAAFWAMQVRDPVLARRAQTRSSSSAPAFGSIPRPVVVADGRQGINDSPAVPATEFIAAHDEHVDSGSSINGLPSPTELLRELPEAQTPAKPNSENRPPRPIADLDAPFRQETFGLAVESEVSAVPDSASRRDIKMMVTPHIIAGDADASAIGVDGQQYAPNDNLGLQESINDAYGSRPAVAAAAAPALQEESQAAAAEEPALLRLYHRGSTAGSRYGLNPLYQEDRGRAWFDDAAGRGPDASGDKYTRVVENDFKAVSASTTDNRLSTFSIDVDTTSYANVRQFLMQSRTLPPPDAVRIEELVNYFVYDYTAPTGDVPFAANVEVASCPWQAEHRLARVAIKGREMDRTKRPQSNLVFLIDVSGSMDEPNKLPLLVDGLKLLTRELGENDRVAMVVYASSEGLALESTPGSDQSKILAALDQLTAGGSTAGGAGIQLAYQTASDNFIKGGVNRVILCTDGDFNVGVTSPAELERMAEAKAKDSGVFLTVLGFGRGNLNDAMMEQVADKGNGNYHYVDTRNEARKVLVEEMAGTLVTIAKDVKIQVEFNPAKVAGYRLIGYENRVMAAEDFNDDKKDAGEIGAGHTVTALYEIVPAGKPVDATEVDELKYHTPGSNPDGLAASAASDPADDEASDELLTLKIRYKEPDGDTSSKFEFPIADSDLPFAKASEDFQFASSVASFGMLLRDSQYKGKTTFAAVAEIAEAASKTRDPHGYRKEFVEMVERAKQLSGE